MIKLHKICKLSAIEIFQHQWFPFLHFHPLIQCSFTLYTSVVFLHWVSGSSFETDCSQVGSFASIFLDGVTILGTDTDNGGPHHNGSAPEGLDRAGRQCVVAPPVQVASAAQAVAALPVHAVLAPAADASSPGYCWWEACIMCFGEEHRGARRLDQDQSCRRHGQHGRTARGTTDARQPGARPEKYKGQKFPLN